MNLEHEFEIKKQIIAGRNRDTAIIIIKEALKKEFTQNGIFITDNGLQEGAIQAFECLKIADAMFDELNRVRELEKI